MPQLTDKVALITGAGRGIGRGIVLAFAREGAALILTSRSADQLQAVAEEAAEVNREKSSYAADVTDEQQVGSSSPASAAVRPARSARE
jgi:meso-butanediol dehydrogenase/(S,S)-butanediol dehydrogenase/diacetyl reductase